MKYFSILSKLAISLAVWGWLGPGAALAGSQHVSGASQGFSTLHHVSGAKQDRIAPPPKQHISGGDQAVPAKSPAPVREKTPRQAGKIGIALGTPDEAPASAPKKIQQKAWKVEKVEVVAKTTAPPGTHEKLLERARSIGITLGTPDATPAPAPKKIQQKVQKVKKVKLARQIQLQDRAKLRKACWAKCEQTWKSGIQERCSGLSISPQKSCKKSLFKERLQCVRQNCRNLTK